MVPRNFKTAKLLQVRREPLRVQQNEFARTQMIHQRHECNLGGIGDPMKHRFPKKRASYCDTVKAAGQLAFLPGFYRMRVAELMQARVALMISSLIHVSSRFAQASITSENALLILVSKLSCAAHVATRAAHGNRLMAEWHADRAKPLDRVILHGHRENTEPIALQQKFGINHSR
jgi:hypothetical protein